VARLVRGAVLVEIALYLGVLMLCVGTPLSIALLPGPGPVPRAIAGATNLALTLMALTGWWLVSAPDPGLRAGSPGERSRITLRVCVLVSGVANVLSFGGVAAAVFDIDPQLHASLVRTGAAVVAVAWIVKYFAGVSYVRVLAARIPSAGLAETARTALLLPIWTFGLGIPLVIGTGTLGLFAPPAGLLTIVVFAAIAIACLVWFIWYCSLVSGLRDRLETVRAMMPAVAAD
jgi:hypothetical protein